MPTASRTAPAVRAGRAGACLLALVGLLAGCGADGAELAAPEEPATTTTTEPPRSVPAAVAGALSTYVPAADEASADAELLLFGDSVAVLVADDLARELDRPLVVDAVDCRRLDLAFTGPCGGVPADEAVDRALDDLAPAVAQLEDPAAATAVVVLANNAALRADDLDAAMAALAPLPRVWWVTTRVGGRAWQDPNNALLVDLARRDDRARVVDWFAASDGQPWLADHVHPGDEGQAALADLIAAHVRCDCTPAP
ncbi:MAG: hypothetical protein ACLGIC_11400 [Acidimicrobiia bacterium]